MIVWPTVIEHIERAVGNDSDKLVRQTKLPAVRIASIFTQRTEPSWSEGLRLLSAHARLCPELHALNFIANEIEA